MLCGPVDCGCSFTSAGLVITGSGQPGDPLEIEPAGPGIVTTSAAVSTPFLGQTIYETVTGRLKVYDGTNWVIYGGAWPGFSAYASGAQSIPNNTTTTITGLTEIYDSDAIHSAGVATIPVGLGGDWAFSAEGDWASNVAGARFLTATIASNASVTGEAGQVSVVDAPNSIYPLPRYIIGDTLRLEAGATVTLSAFQNSGGALNLSARKFRLRMVRHIPSLV